MAVLAAVALPLFLLRPAAAGAGEVSAKMLPENPEPARRETWSAASAGGELAHGAALEGAGLLVLARPGQDVVELLVTTGPQPALRARLVVTGDEAGSALSIAKVELEAGGDAGPALKLTMGDAGAGVRLTLRGDCPCVSVAPLGPARWLDVRTDARYAVLPDFFADDTVFDPVRYSSARMTVPAENFLLHLAAGGRSMVMCTWPGSAGAAPAGDADAAIVPVPEEPRVVLEFEGEAAARRVAGSTIELLGGPVHVGMLEGEGLWYDADIAGWPGYRPRQLEWKPPFPAKWRADFIVAEGKSMSNWRTRQQSFDFMKAGKDGKPPEVWQESLKSDFLYPAYLNGEAAFLCPYVDKAVRRKTEETAPGTPPGHAYERAVTYPLDRSDDTPPTAWTPVDVLRSTLGQGPCEYVLDLEGLRTRSSGGQRQLLAGNTCALWDNHIKPDVAKIEALKPGDKLDAKTTEHLARALEDTKVFVVIVADRIREYIAWADETAEFAKQQGARSTAVKPLADRVLAQLETFRTEMAEVRFEGDGTEGYWKDRIDEFIAGIGKGDYSRVAEMGRVRTLGGYQDGKVSRCRQHVKAVRQEVMLADTANAELRAFVDQVRERCHRILRNKHRKEGL